MLLTLEALYVKAGMGWKDKALGWKDMALSVVER